MVETINKGYVCQIIGPVLDIEFPSGNLPPIYSAIRIETADGIGNIVEVQQLLGDNKVRAVSMRSTDGLKRGVEAVDLGTPILVPDKSEAMVISPLSLLTRSCRPARPNEPTLFVTPPTPSSVI